MANDAGTSKTVAKRIAQDKATMLKALQETPNVTMACKKAAVKRPTFYRWCAEDPDFLEKSEGAYAEGIEFRNDMADSGLMLGVQERRHASIMGWLKHNHPRYMRVQKIPALTQREERIKRRAEELEESPLRNSEDIEEQKRALGKKYEDELRDLIVKGNRPRNDPS